MPQYKQFLALFLILSAPITFLFSEELQNPFLRFENVTLSKNQTSLSSVPLVLVPPGNGSIQQIPEFPLFTTLRLGLSLHGFALSEESRMEIAKKLASEKIPEIMETLDRQGLLKEAVQIAKLFQIHPLHILGPVIGENTFNGFIDSTIQNSLHKVFQQTDIQIMSHRLMEMSQPSEAQTCLQSKMANYWKWRCVVFYSSYTGRNSNRDLVTGFYSFSLSQGNGTFGIGQMQPFLIWSLNDIVSEKTGSERFQFTEFDKSMKIIFNHKEMLAYIAAQAVVSIQVYKLIAGVDLSNNPGLTTTLYNVGDEYQRAYIFNSRRQKDLNEMPKVNYMGWFVNHFEKKIQSYLTKYK